MRALKINRAMLASSGNAEGKPAFIIDSGFYRREFYTLDAAKRHADELCSAKNWKFAQVREYFSRAVVYTARKGAQCTN